MPSSKTGIFKDRNGLEYLPITEPELLKSEKSNGYTDLEDMFKKITRTLIAQDEPLRRVITEIARKEQNPDNKRR